jgi:hypothetical protein
MADWCMPRGGDAAMLQQARSYGIRSPLLQSMQDYTRIIEI